MKGWDEHAPMPVRADVAGTVREQTDGLVARVFFTDVVGDQRILDLTPDVAFALALDLLVFVKQVS